MKLALSITHKGERRIERITLDDQPIVIGRSWDSDLILDDKYVDAHHLKLSKSDDGQVEVQDLGTLNGTFVDKHRLQEQSQSIAVGTTLVLGDTHIKLYDQSQSVAPATVRSQWFLLIERLSTPIGLTLLTVLALGLDGAVSWLTSASKFDSKDLSLELAFLFVGAMCLVLVMGLLSKLVRKEMNLKAHWVLVMLGTVAYLLVALALDVLSFNLQAPKVSELIRVLVLAALAAAVVVGFLSYSTHLSSQARWSWALILASLIALSSYSDQWRREEHQRWSGTSNTETITLPKWLLFRPTTTVDQHQASTDELFTFDEL